MQDIVGGILQTLELRGIARGGLHILGQITLPLSLSPATRRRVKLIGKAISINLRKNVTSAAQSIFDVGHGWGAQACLEFVIPYLRGGLRVIGETAEQFEEVPVALEFVVVITVLGREEIKRLQVMGLSGHLSCQRFVNIETIRIPEMSALCEASYVFRATPKQYAH